MGDPMYANIILLGALMGADVLPVGREAMLAVLRERFTDAVYNRNIEAFDKGMELFINGAHYSRSPTDNATKNLINVTG